MTLRPGLFVTDDDNDVVSSQDARLALAALLSGTGILFGGAVTGTSDGPNIDYAIAKAAWSVARGERDADGLYVVSNDGSVSTADLDDNAGTPAPASGSRYDLIWVRQQNALTGDGFGDSTSDPEYGVTQGDASSSPSKPTGDVPAGALVIASALVDSTATSGADVTITMEAARVVTNGSPIPVSSTTERDALTAYTGLQVSRLDAGGQVQTYNGTAWVPDVVWTAITAFYGNNYQANSFGYGPAYRVLAGGEVELSGIVAKVSGTFASGSQTIINNVPAAMQPAAYVETSVVITSNTTTVTGRLEITSGGKMNLILPAAVGSWLSLDGIRYRSA